MTNLPIYLDNSATTCVRQEVVDAMLPALQKHWGNPSSIHGVGRSAHDLLDKSRERVAALIGCAPEEIYFTAGGTYSNNIALLGRARFCEANDLGKHLIITQIEHPALLGPAKYLESQGWKVTYLPVSHEGLVSASDLKKAITRATSIISIMWANNEIGTVQPIAELCGIASDAKIYFHTDAIQVAGKLPIDLAKISISALSLSGHKFHAPKGIGALFVRKGFNFMPLMFGGGQEKGMFPGTEPLPNIVGLGAAAELALSELESNILHLRKLQMILMDKLQAVDGVKITGPSTIESRLPGHVSLTVNNAEGQTIIMRADFNGVCISSGSACHLGITEPSHVLKAINLAPNESIGAVRISAGRFNTEQECIQAADILAEVFAICQKAGKLQGLNE